MNRLRAIGAALLVLGGAATTDKVQRDLHGERWGEVVETVEVPKPRPRPSLDYELKEALRADNEYAEYLDREEPFYWQTPEYQQRLKEWNDNPTSLEQRRTREVRETFWGTYHQRDVWTPGPAEPFGWVAAAIGLALVVGSLGRRQEEKGGAA